MFEQMPTFVFAQIRPPRMAHLTETATQREMPGGLFAGGEMMMVPTFRRHEQTSRLPVDPNKFAAGRPHQRIPFAGNDNHLCSRAMAMSFFVSAGFDSHDMADHGVAGKVNAQATKADASLRMIIKLDRRQIRNEIDLT